MSEEPTKDRSPRAPAYSLEKCIDAVTKIYASCRRNAVEAETAAKAMGFNTVHGGVATLLASVREYGLIERPGGKVVVTSLAIKIIHPVSEQQKGDAIKEAALTPRVFATLLADFGDGAENVLESHLVQSGFNPERARQVAKAFTANKAFAKFDADGSMDVMELEEGDETPKPKPKSGTNDPQLALTLQNNPSQTSIGRSLGSPSTLTPPGNSFLFKGEMLAQYHIPLGANQAYLAFTGEELVPEDFEALIEYVELFKKQFQRKLKTSAKPAPEVINVPPSREVTNDYLGQHGSMPPKENDPKSEFDLD